MFLALVNWALQSRGWRAPVYRVNAGATPVSRETKSEIPWIRPSRFTVRCDAAIMSAFAEPLPQETP